MEKRNLLLITIDCLRADHLSFIGRRGPNTPNLDALAKEGVSFTQAISVGPETSSSFIALHSSTYPLMFDGYLRLSNYRTTLAEVLKRHGYVTAAFHSNPFLSRSRGFSRGFDTFYDSITSVKSKPFILNFFTRFAKRLGLSKYPYPYVRASAMNKMVLTWLRKHPKNFFVWLHYMDVHHPYLPPKDFKPKSIDNDRIKLLNEKLKSIGKKGRIDEDELSSKDLEDVRTLYGCMVKYVDHVIGALLEDVQEVVDMGNTFIVITADHGIELCEHGGLLHSTKLYDELLKVPLIIWGPDLRKGVVEDQVSLLDLAPTILDLLRIPKPSAFLGKSLLPIIRGNYPHEEEAVVISEVGHKQEDPSRILIKERQIALRTPMWKFIYKEQGVHELYNLKHDPKEQKNLIFEEPEAYSRFRRLAHQHIALLKKSRVIVQRISRVKEVLELSRRT